MKTRNIENRLAFIGALVVLIGVLFAASSALATEATDAPRVTVARQKGADATIISARQAMTEAAVEAAEALKAASRLDLEIQLKDLTSTLAVRSR